MRCCLVLFVALVGALPRVARADQPPPASASPEPDAFGPLIMIEDIEVIGNVSTQTELILRALPLRAGDVLHAGDKRLRAARYQVLALGFFRDVTLGMRKGRARGQVVLEVEVVERGTVVLNRLWFGTTDVAPYWVGADVSERNLLGLGLELGEAGHLAQPDGERERHLARRQRSLAADRAGGRGAQRSSPAARTGASIVTLLPSERISVTFAVLPALRPASGSNAIT
jgi:hypothetical protein